MFQTVTASLARLIGRAAPKGSLFLYEWAASPAAGDSFLGQLNLKKVQKSYGTFEVLKGIELEVRNGEFVVFVGPSGCGKSTLAADDRRSRRDHVPATSMIDGKRVERPAAGQARRLPWCSSRYALYPHMTVFENIAFPPARREDA